MQDESTSQEWIPTKRSKVIEYSQGENEYFKKQELVKIQKQIDKIFDEQQQLGHSSAQNVTETVEKLQKMSGTLNSGHQAMSLLNEYLG